MIKTSINKWIVVTLSFGVALASYRFIGLGLVPAFPDFVEHLDNRVWTFVVHVGAAPIALVTGAVQFIDSIRRNRPRVHRWIGRIYVCSVMVGGISGLVLAISAIGGPIASLGFASLSVLWMAFTINGLRMARSRRFTAHRRWMIRSFALTFAAVTLRLYLPAFIVSGIGYAPASVYLAWMCWVPNLLVAHWWLVRYPSLPNAEKNPSG